jgi:transcriptional regulator
MYIPSAFKIEDLSLIHEIVRANAFATLVTTLDGEPWATHLPIMLSEIDGQDVLVGHVAKANPHWKSFGTKSLVIFAGPHGYISPAWYETRPNVPTWNYVAVHAYGTPELVEDADWSVAHLQQMVRTFDPGLAGTNPESTEDDFVRGKLGGLVGFRMPVDRWDAKAKLNQNKVEADRLAIRERFLNSEGPQEQAMAVLMPQSLTAE